MIMRNPEKNSRIHVNDISVSYLDEGPIDAPVIVFIHGFPFNKSMWNSQVEALKDQYRVIAYDVRGHSDSDSGTVQFSIEQFVSDLIGFMDALKIEKATLCGLSMGGYIALNALENYAQRFDALILCDTQCTADTPETKEKRMKAIENIKKHGVEQYADESIKNLFAPESFQTRLSEIAAIKAMIRNTSPQSISQTLLALASRKETCSILPFIKIPVLIMVGEKDMLTPPSAARRMHEKIKGSLLNILDHAGHLSNMENPDAFNSQLIKFVSSVYQKTSTEK